MNKTWRWLALTAAAVVLAAAALLWANNIFAGGRGASPAPNLANTSWLLNSINRQPPIAGRALTLSFQSDSQFGGNSGCNSYGGQYHASGSTMSLSQMISTLMACAEQPLNDQEAAFQKALGDATQLSLAGNQLTLKNASGGEVLVFQRQ
jgi:heat shock protein HslJ